MRKMALSLLLIIAIAGCAGQAGTAAQKTGTTQKTVDRIVAADLVGMYLTNGDLFVSQARAANLEWTEVRLEMGDSGTADNQKTMWFEPKNLVLEAGKPYKLVLANTGSVKHEFAAEEFFPLVAFRKIEDDNGEVKATYFTEVEVFAGKEVELFIIPLVPGTYDSVCEIKGHKEKGMFGTITVTGEMPSSPKPEFRKISEGNWVHNGDALVAAARAVNKTWTEVSMEIGDSGPQDKQAKMWFTPKDIKLKAGEPYKIVLANVGSVKHEFSAEEFFTTAAFRKVEDSQAEFKSPAFTEIEVFAGKEIEVFLIPTKTGTFDSVCAIEGHKEKGMFGTITVE